MQFADQLTSLATSGIQTSTAARGILHRHLGNIIVHFPDIRDTGQPLSYSAPPRYEDL